MTNTLYPVTELFLSVQGEGLNAGRSAWFIRFAGCNLACPGCDEPLHDDNSKVTKMTASEIVNTIVGQPADVIVITGGEPTLYDLTELCDEINRLCIPVEFRSDAVDFTSSWPASKWHPLCGDMQDECDCNIAGPLICIETNGTREIRGDVDFVCVSPKPLEFAKNTEAKIEYNLNTLDKADEVKIVVGWNKNLDEEVEFFTSKCRFAVLLFSPLTTFPEGELVRESAEKAVEYTKKYVGSRLSPQWHKWLKIR